MELIEKTISNLVENQFPQFYKEEGPFFIEFVKHYYKWLETNQMVADREIPLATVATNVANNTLIGKNTRFEEDFIANDYIAVYREDYTDYLIYQIDFIANNTVLTLKTNPLFSYANVKIATVKDQKNTNYHARHFFEYKDVDDTTEEFLLYFKEKYLKDIRFETKTNSRQLIKHALDIYRSKGTERAIDLMFRLVFGRGAEIYYPGEDIFKLSDGKWFVPKYLEVSLNANNKRFAGKQVVGVTSGAKAFVESVIRRNVKGKLVDVLFISAINGNFQTGEVITVLADDILTKESIKIIGSLTAIDININGVGSGYSVGDVIDITSVKGEKGKARVSSISNVTGLIQFELLNGGYGFTANSEIIVSEKVFTISNVNISIANNKINNYFKLFETITQPKAYINFNSATDTFVAGDNVYTYHANNDIKGSGKVLDVALTGSGNGTILVSVANGDLDEATIYVSNGTANTKSASLNFTNGYYNATATANVMGIASNVSLYVSNVSGEFIRNDEVYQLNANNVEIANGKVITFGRTVGANGIIKVGNIAGVFNSSLELVNRTRTGSANITSQDINIGVFDISNNSFVSFDGNYIYSSNVATNGTVTFISSGTSAGVSISNDFLYEESVQLNNDFLLDYATVPLNSSNYGFPPAGSETLSTIIGNAISANYYDVGKIRILTNINQGQNYNLPPFVTAYDRAVYSLKRYDSILNLISPANFAIGELVTQSSTGARGIVKSNSNSSVVYVERMRINDANNFAITTSTSSQIIGEKSGAIANVQLIEPDLNSKYLGINALINTQTVGGNGAITALEVVDSGFGYTNGEEIVFENENGQSTGTVKLGLAGRGQGFYKKKGGFLSDQKKLFDGLYYQEYSYDILSSVALNKYEDMLKRILHVAGTKYFGSLVYSTKANSALSYSGTGFNITIEVPGTLVIENGNNLIMTETSKMISREI